MPKYEDYIKQSEFKFQTQEMDRFLDHEEISSPYELSYEQLQERFDQREEAGSFQDRTRYYFQDAEVMEAKATRYRNIANGSTGMRNFEMEVYSSKYKNHSARKRKKSAKEAAGAFKEAAKLERKYQGDFAEGAGVTSVKKFKHRKEIMKARLEGMIKAAEVKSHSKENEQYRILKAKMSCYRVLREQAKELFESESDEALKHQLEIELGRINVKLLDYEKEMVTINPPLLVQWDKGLGFPEELESKKEEFQEGGHPDVNDEDTEIQIKMTSMNSFIFRPECKEALTGLENSGMYAGRKFGGGDLGRLLTFGLRTVLTDKNGLPVNKAEAKKLAENREWLDALSTGNVEKKNMIIERRFKQFMKMRIPSPKELSQKGVIGMLRDNPAEFNEIMNFSTVVDNLGKVDPYVYEYIESHPEISKKLKAAVAFGTATSSYMITKHNLSRSGDKYAFKYGMSKADSSDQFSIDCHNGIMVEYAKMYNDYYNDSNAPYSVEVGEKLDDTQKQSLKFFHENIPDTYDGQMRKKLGGFMESKLGHSIASSEVKADSIKIKIQDDMRRGLESFLNDRQLNIANGARDDMFSYLIRKKIWEEKTDIRKKLPEQIDKDFLQYALDWSQMQPGKNAVDDSSGGIAKRSDTQKSYAAIADVIAKDGKTLLDLDIDKFNYDNDENFALHLKENYVWLKRAESLKAALDKAKEDGVLKPGKIVALSAVEGRLLALLDVKADYDARIAMIGSNYYALESEEDLNSLTDEQLKARIDEAVADKNTELADFLNSYKTVRDKKDGFKIGGKAKDIEKVLTEPIKKKEAERQNGIYKKMKELDLIKKKGEGKEAYEDRVIAALIQKAETEIPKEFDSDYIRKNMPPKGNMTGINLTQEGIHKLEIWFEDQMADLEALKKKGMTEEEISKLQEIRKNTYAARRNLELQNYIQMKLCPDWQFDEMETPQQNNLVDKRHYQLMKAPCEALFNKLNTIGVTKKQKMVPQVNYTQTLQQATEFFVKHNIYFNEDVPGMLKKYEEKAQKRIGGEIPKDEKIQVKIGNTSYDMHIELSFMKECNNMAIDESKKADLEDKIKQLNELSIKIESTRLIRVEAKEGVYFTEIVKIREGYINQAKQIKDEIKALAR